jgi:hypothetical protein
MRAFSILLSIASVTTISGALHAATAPRPIHPEREKMSEARKHDLILGDLQSILTGPASPTTIATAPYASTVDGLCQRDLIQLKYASKSDDRVDTRVHPIGVRVTVQYHYLGGTNDRRWSRQQKACEQLAGKKIYWAFAADDYSAAGALATLGSTLDDVRENRRFTIDCSELDAREIEIGCAQRFLSTAAQVSAISRRYDRRDSQYDFTSSPYQFTIARTYSNQLDGGYSTAITIRYQEILVY